MEQNIVKVGDRKLVGLKVRTCNHNEFNPLTAKIAPLVGRYWAENIADKIPHRKNPGTVFSGYGDYASDYNSDYTYFIGEEVTSFEGLPQGLEIFMIAEGSYARFTSDSAPMPQVVIGVWQHIWQLETSHKLGGDRRYFTDFEVYDERAKDPLNTIVDVYIGLKSE